MQSVSRGCCFETVCATEERVERFACFRAVSGSGAQIVERGGYLFQLVFER